MYESFYGLAEKPFELHPDPDYVYMSRGHEDAYALLQYATDESKGFVVITGEIGSGKTTLVNVLLNTLPGEVRFGVVNNTLVDPGQFLNLVCHEFELPVAGADKPAMLHAFSQYLVERYAARERVVLVVDEAQNLPARTLEEIRLLSNVEAEKQHLLQVILVGQPELKHKLQRDELRQFAQRVTGHYHLSSLNREEVKWYVRHRLRVAGLDNPHLFDEEALEAVWRLSNGIPRLINVLCDTALVFGFGEDRRTIGLSTVEDVVRDRRGFEVPDGPNGDQGAVLLNPTVEPVHESQNQFTALEERLQRLERDEGEICRRLAALEQNDRKIAVALQSLHRKMATASPILLAQVEEEGKTNLNHREPLAIKQDIRALLTRRFGRKAKQLLRAVDGCGDSAEELLELAERVRIYVQIFLDSQTCGTTSRDIRDLVLGAHPSLSC
jgi:general secretion pathway protein A